ncbi:MAG: tRNA 2-thiouridine(34) synthase MnmA, partial [Actinobacteria bacterium]|nr:tRNA 2-thiouridine(34) synthase MnmA [Actinomycetota bacterium]
MTKKVVAAMSGGVDSSVAAARLVDQGYDVVGVHLALAKVKGHAGGKGCCTLDDARDARRVADRLGIAFYIWDVSEEFQQEVIENFISEYAQGRTPNPCVRCNEKIKFQAVLERSLALGFDAVATGHYAQIFETPNGPTLHRAIDSKKDQSYVLSVLNQEQLSHTILPLGNSVKPDIRKEAEERGLITAAKPDSHDICFIPDGDTAGFLHNKLGQEPGKIVDAETGEELGKHDGVFEFTIGQRKGLYLEKPRPDRSPRYVVGTDTKSKTVMVGLASMLRVDVVTATNLIWCGPIPDSQFDCTAQVRAHSNALKAKAFHKDGNLTVEFLEPF